MREILFHAKRKNWRDLQKEEWWVEGYFAKLGYLKNIKYFIIQNVSLQVDISYFEDIEIDPETLCQYTGLQDKNSKQIWENDIVRCKSGETAFSYDEIMLIDDIATYQTMSILTEFEDLEVLGNRFDTPELLSQCINF